MADVFLDNYTGAAGAISGHAPDVAPVGLSYSTNNGDPRLNGSGSLINFETNGFGDAVTGGADVEIASYPFTVTLAGKTNLIGFGQFRLSMNDGVSEFKVFMDVRRDAPTEAMVFCRVFIDSQGANFGYEVGSGNLDVELKATFYENGDVDIFVNGVQVLNEGSPWVFDNAPPPLVYTALYPGIYADNSAGWNYAELTQLQIADTSGGGATIVPQIVHHLKQQGIA